MSLPSMPSSFVGQEYLRVGGGYDAPAAGASPAGGLDADNTGNVATNGDVTIKGVIAAGATPQVFTNNSGELNGARLEAGTVAAAALADDAVTPAKLQDAGDFTVNDLTLTGDLAVQGTNRTWNYTIPITHGTTFGGTLASMDLGAQQPKFPYWSYPVTVFTEVCFPFVLPVDYDSSPLKVTVYWTANGGTVSEVVHWRIYCQSFVDGEDLDGPTDNLLMPMLHGSNDTFQGALLVHKHQVTLTPTSGTPGAMCFLTVRRHTTSTLTAAAWVMGVHVTYA